MWTGFEYSPVEMSGPWYPTAASRELMAEVYPAVPYRSTAGDFDTLLSIQKAHTLLGYEPRWSWRDHIAGT